MHSRLGVFLSPVHELGQDPHLALYRTLELVERLDELNMTKLGSASTIHSAGASSGLRKR